MNAERMSSQKLKKGNLFLISIQIQNLRCGAAKSLRLESFSLFRLAKNHIFILTTAAALLFYRRFVVSFFFGLLKAIKGSELKMAFPCASLCCPSSATRQVNTLMLNNGWMSKLIKNMKLKFNPLF